MPPSVILEVVSTEPGVKGNTATNATKPATLETDVVLANSALAISTAKEIGISEAFDLAKDSLLSKKALKSFNTLIELSKWMFWIK